MRIASIVLNNFRNYDQLSLDFSPGLNVLYGENAQGKTNLLEAIYFLATGRSHRTARDQDLVREGSNRMSAKATIARRTGDLQVELSLGAESRKQLKINGVPERKITRLVGRLAAVLFSPDDLDLVKGPPSGRRRFLDIELSQISENYLHHLVNYTRILGQRNTLLKAEPVDQSLLAVYDEQLLEAGAQLIHRRAEAILRLAPIAASFHATLADGKEELAIEYQSQGAEPGQCPGVPEIQERLWSLLQQRKRDEIRRQVTLVGPHRDDIAFTINGRDARLFASQGQQRTTVLALKLAELRFMGEELGESPILLLDDVASELDPNRRNYLLNAVQEEIQTFISCTDLEDLATRSWPPDHRIFRIKSGSVEADARRLG